MRVWDNDLLERIAKDPAFGLSLEDVRELLKPEDYVGRSAEQTQELIDEYIMPILDKNRDCIGGEVELRV